MTRTEYEMLQEQLSALLVREKMQDKGITGKRKEGYEAAILAAKSVVKNFFERLGKENKLTGYERYQLEWMIEHGRSLQEFIGDLEDIQYGDPEDEDKTSTPVQDLYNEWKAKGGFTYRPEPRIFLSKKEWEAQCLHG